MPIIITVEVHPEVGMVSKSITCETQADWLDLRNFILENAHRAHYNTAIDDLLKQLKDPKTRGE
jgi:hypothetical protein